MLSGAFLDSHSYSCAMCSHAGELAWAVSTSAARSPKAWAAKPSVSSEINQGFPKQDFRKEKWMGALERGISGSPGRKSWKLWISLGLVLIKTDFW